MSEPTLYQRGHPAFEEPVHWDWLDELVRAGVLVPREPCVHGNTGAHVISDPKRTYHPGELCLGAGIGGDK